MPTKIVFVGGETLRVAAAPDEVQASFNGEGQGWRTLERTDGRRVLINAQQVLYLEEERGSPGYAPSPGR